MFVRFRAVRHRLVVDLVESRRDGGEVKSEHIARLGSVALPEPIGAKERVRFWRELKDRFRDLAARLGNRVAAADRRKALAVIHERIPKPSEDEERVARVEAARANVAFWEWLRDGSSERAAARRGLIEHVEKELADDRAMAAAAERR
jgi:hypothetical protein